MCSLRRQIASIAFPAIISNITTPLLAMIDVAIAGHVGAALYIGAVALGSSMFNMIYWLFGFLRMGSSGLTAQAYGAGDRPVIGIVLYRALAVGLAAGVLIFVFSLPVSSVLLRFMDADQSTLPVARTYFLIAVSGAPATLGSYSLSGWLLGMQDSRTPMWMSLITNVINIIISLVLVFVLGMRIEGIAIGSAVAQWCGFIFGLVMALKRYKPLRPSLKDVLDIDGLKRFFTINADIFLRTLCLVAVTVWFTRSGSVQGVDILAANAVLLQLFMFFSYFMDGFAFSGEALAGKYYGRRDLSSLGRLVSALMRIGLVMSLAFGLFYIFCGRFIFVLLADDPHVIGICERYLWWAAAVPLAGTCAFILDGILIGLTRTRLMLISMVAATAIFFTIYFATCYSMGNHGLWLAFIVYLFVRGLAEYLLYRYKCR